MRDHLPAASREMYSFMELNITNFFHWAKTSSSGWSGESVLRAWSERPDVSIGKEVEF
jgi:hypothetical protein